MEILPDFAWNPPEEIFYIERVIDWEDRIATYPPKIKNMYREALSKRHQLLDLFNEPKGSNGWATTGTQDGFLVEERYSERGFPTIRVECKYDYDVLTIWRVYHNFEVRKKYDPLVGDISVAT